MLCAVGASSGKAGACAVPQRRQASADGQPARGLGSTTATLHRAASRFAVETQEGLLEEHRYLNMWLLVGQKEEQMRMLEAA